MREILFRGKRVENGKWVDGDLVKRDKSFYVLQSDSDDYECNEVNPETVGQYAELKDKNGVKIFEGDVVRYLNSIESGNGVVIFDTCAFLFNWIDIDETDSLLRYFQCSKELEVIGNIHDNTEVTE